MWMKSLARVTLKRFQPTITSQPKKAKGLLSPFLHIKMLYTKQILLTTVIIKIDSLLQITDDMSMQFIAALVFERAHLESQYKESTNKMLDVLPYQ